MNAHSFVVAEHVPALLFGKEMGDAERSADSAAELIPAERADGGEEKAAGVEDVVAQEFPGVAVPLVGAGFGNEVYSGARSMTVDAGGGAGFHLHFGDGFGRWEQGHSQQV